LKLTGDPRSVDALRADAAAAAAKLESKTSDTSLGELMLQKASYRLTGPEAPDASGRRLAQVVLDEVLPAYFATLEPPKAAQTQIGKVVTITLVRWPYT
jgi:hypothetical protein